MYPFDLLHIHLNPTVKRTCVILNATIFEKIPPRFYVRMNAILRMKFSGRRMCTVLYASNERKTNLRTLTAAFDYTRSWKKTERWIGTTICLKNGQYSHSVFHDPRAFLTEYITAGGTRFSLLSPRNQWIIPRTYAESSSFSCSIPYRFRNLKKYIKVRKEKVTWYLLVKVERVRLTLIEMCREVDRREKKTDYRSTESQASFSPPLT